MYFPRTVLPDSQIQKNYFSDSQTCTVRSAAILFRFQFLYKKHLNENEDFQNLNLQFQKKFIQFGVTSTSHFFYKDYKLPLSIALESVTLNGPYHIQKVSILKVCLFELLLRLCTRNQVTYFLITIYIYKTKCNMLM